ncbi:MAG: hypothetical protein V9G19_23350 [Tetrasphaera sp.]
MQPSSLIFLIVIAIWAAYLVQHWLRRREHLSTARTMDRFSQSMRILDRTKAGRASAPGPVSTTGSIPLHRRSARVSVAEVAGGATMAVEVPDRAPAAAAPVRGGSGRARTVVGGVFVAAVALTLAGAVLAAVGAVGWGVPGVAVVIGLASFAVLSRIASRSVASSGTAASSAGAAPVSRPAQRPPSSASVRRQGAAPRGRSAPPAAASATRAPAASGPAPALVGATAAVASSRSRAEVYDVAALDAAPVRAEPAVAAEQVPGAWSPVPVPPPTYTLKAKAVYPTPLEDADDDDVASPYAAAPTRGRHATG